MTHSTSLSNLPLPLWYNNRRPLANIGTNLQQVASTFTDIDTFEDHFQGQTRSSLLLNAFIPRSAPASITTFAAAPTVPSATPLLSRTSSRTRTCTRSRTFSGESDLYTPPTTDLRPRKRRQTLSARPSISSLGRSRILPLNQPVPPIPRNQTRRVSVSLRHRPHSLIFEQQSQSQIQRQEVFSPMDTHAAELSPFLHSFHRPRVSTSLPTPSTVAPTPTSPTFLGTEVDAMSFFNPTSSCLNVMVEIEYGNGGKVDMVGPSNTGTSYSLPGHVIMHVPVLPRSMRDKVREVRLLEIKWEAMTEYSDEHGRYNPMRVHEQVINLVRPSQPIQIPAFDAERPQLSKMRIAIPFDFRLPGWLPPSIAARFVNVAYGAIARVVVGWSASLSPTKTVLGFPSRRLGSDVTETSMDAILPSRRIAKTSKMTIDGLFASSSSLPFRSTSSARSRYTPFTVCRHRLPGATMMDGHNRVREMTIKPQVGKECPIDLSLILPEWIDVNGEERSIKLTLKIRENPSFVMGLHDVQPKSKCKVHSAGANVATGSEASAQSTVPPPSAPAFTAALPSSVPMQRSTPRKSLMKTYIEELSVEVEEDEEFSSTSYTSWQQSYPVPVSQPNRANTIHPLIAPRSKNADLNSLMSNSKARYRGCLRRRMLLDERGNERSYAFPDGGLELFDHVRNVKVMLPMLPAAICERPSPEHESPFLRVRHALKVSVSCRSTMPGRADEYQRVTIRTAMKFGSMPSTVPKLPNVVYEPPLPAYVQLFHENGDVRHCDPLPLYSRDPNYKDDPPAFTSAAGVVLPLAPLASTAQPLKASPIPLTPVLPRCNESVDTAYPQPGQPGQPGQDTPAALSASISRSASPPSSDTADEDYPMDSSSEGEMESDGDGDMSMTGAGDTTETDSIGSGSGSESESVGQQDGSGQSMDERRRPMLSLLNPNPLAVRTVVQDGESVEMEMVRERERERERRSLAPPPVTPRTPGGRKALRVSTAVRAAA